MPDNVAIAEYMARFSGEYIANQYNGFVNARRHIEHKARIKENDLIYQGDLQAAYPEESLSKYTKVENKYRNALHDLARLASEAKPAPTCHTLGNTEKAKRKKRVREMIDLTIWEMGGGPDLERRLYMDLAGTGMVALALFANSKSDYTQFMRLDPRYCYPEQHNGKLTSMVYAETIKRSVAAQMWPDLNIPHTPGNSETQTDLTIITYYDERIVYTAVCETSKGGTASKAWRTDIWAHELDCVPVAFKMLDTADGEFRGMFDQLGGVLMMRNKIVNYLDDYMDDMVHAPFESKNILNADDVPGPLTVYQHDPNAEESFQRRVAPAAPAGAVFGLAGYLDDQEAKEAIQPPSRVGNVSQSIASGSFVSSTQGSLSSAVKELQDYMAGLRKQVCYISSKIEKKYLNRPKPLLIAVDGKTEYTPEEDIADIYTMRYLFGAAAGVDRQYADVRLIQFHGMGAIDMDTVRANIDFVDDPVSVQAKIDMERTATVLFQRLTGDPATPMPIIAELMMALGKGKTLIEAITDVAPQLVQQPEQPAAPEAGIPGTEPIDAAAEQLALEKGGAPEEGLDIAPISPFAPPPLQQQIVSVR